MTPYLFSCVSYGWMHAQVFLELAATAGVLGNTWQGGYPTKAVFVEQFYKPTALQRATKVVTELQGKPRTLAIGSDTMVSHLSAQNSILIHMQVCHPSLAFGSSSPHPVPACTLKFRV